MPPFSFQKSTKIASKIDLVRHRLFDRFLHRCFIDLGSFLEANLESCWPLFRQNVGKYFLVHPVFCWVYVLFRFFGRPDVHRAKNVARGARFGKVLGSILDASCDNSGLRLLLENPRLLLENLSFSFGSSWKTWSFDPFCWRLVLDGLVGLREALRI